jgi:predicted N-acyltransferase
VIRHYQARSIDELDPERWDAVQGDRLSMNSRWLRAMEAANHFYEPLYVLLEDAHGPCAAVVANTSRHIFINVGLVGYLYQRANLTVMPPFSAGSGVAVRSGVSLPTMIPHLSRVIDDLCRQENRIMSTIMGIGASELDCWTDQGFIPLAQPGMCILDLPHTYEEYLQMLRHKDRAELRRIHRRAEESDVHVECATLAGEGERVFPLFREVFIRHGTPEDAIPFTSSLFECLDRDMPGQAVLFKGFVGEDLIGVSLCIRNGSELWWPMAGLHYRQARPTYIYFLLIDEMIRWSIENQIQRIHGGRTNEREKQRHGFHLKERWLGCRVIWPPVNKVVSFGFPLARRWWQSTVGEGGRLTPEPHRVSK